MNVEQEGVRVDVSSDVEADDIARYIAFHLQTTPEVAEPSKRVQYAVELCQDVSIHSEGCVTGPKALLRVGAGRTAFTFHGQQMTFVCKVHQPPLTSHKRGRDTTLHTSVHILAPDTATVQRLCLCAYEHAKCDIPEHFQTLKWDPSSEYWRRAGYTPYRPMDSIVMEPEVKESIVSDVKDFMSSDTKTWFTKHGVPHRRGYLFKGPPGTGKTSMLCAIATLIGSKVHYVSLVSPQLGDDSLMTAMKMVEPNSLIVMEDLDALFNKHREKNEACLLTFSGLLNAIDGVNASVNGCILVMTTNHADKLDPALVRSGRVDVVYTFSNASDVTCRGMFNRFYPDDDGLAAIFLGNVKGVFASRNCKMPSMSDLQSHFIRMRSKTSTEAASKASIVEMCIATNARDAVVGTMWT